jgi:nicotinate-nucleotide--dimethylbenzimidazole phosphoribosyltransferase
MEKKLQHKIDLKTKPLGSLGKLEQIALKIGSIQQSTEPAITRPTILVFAADHGITESGVSSFPREVTFQMVKNFLQGGAAINVFCRQHQINLKVVDAGVDFDFTEDSGLVMAKIARGTRNFLNEPAMSGETCAAALEKGKELVEKEYNEGCNTIGFGEMGIGNTSSASLLMHKYTGFDIKQCTGRGTGHDDAGLQRKIAILTRASEKHKVRDPLDILAAYGGLEIAMMCGAMIRAMERGMIILVDG